jgi:hypothetical protein
MWRPRLRIRPGKACGISSFASTSGYLLQGAIALVAAVALVRAAHDKSPLVLIALPIPAVFVRDAWAWFAASNEERESFRRAMRGVADQGVGPTPDRVIRVQMGTFRWSVWLALVGTLFLGCFYLTPALFPVAGIGLAAAIVPRLDALRGPR